MTITTIIGVVGGLAMIGFEYFSTGQVTPEKLTIALSFAGLGFFAKDGVVLVPIIAKVLNFGLDKATGKETKEEVLIEEDWTIISPSKLPNEDRTASLRKEISDKTKLSNPMVEQKPIKTAVKR